MKRVALRGLLVAGVVVPAAAVAGCGGGGVGSTEATTAGPASHLPKTHLVQYTAWESISVNGAGVDVAKFCDTSSDQAYFVGLGRYKATQTPIGECPASLGN